MDLTRYNHVRENLVSLYKTITEETFNVYIPKSSFLSLKQIKQIEKNPPINGMESYDNVIERPLSILRMAQAFSMVGEDDVNLAFRYPRKDIPRIYNTIQDYIMYWLEIKRNYARFDSPGLDELEILEKVAKYVFSAYKEYHIQEVNDKFGVVKQSDMTLMDYIKGTWMYGEQFQENISFISHLAVYREENNLSQSHHITQSSSDLLRDLMALRNKSGMGD